MIHIERVQRILGYKQVLRNENKRRLYNVYHCMPAVAWRAAPAALNWNEGSQATTGQGPFESNCLDLEEISQGLHGAVAEHVHDSVRWFLRHTLKGFSLSLHQRDGN